jgi:hypothetical protein
VHVNAEQTLSEELRVIKREIWTVL